MTIDSSGADARLSAMTTDGSVMAGRNYNVTGVGTSDSRGRCGTIQGNSVESRTWKKTSMICGSNWMPEKMRNSSQAAAMD